jgi:hypothetical protein
MFSKKQLLALALLTTAYCAYPIAIPGCDYKIYHEYTNKMDDVFAQGIAQMQNIYHLDRYCADKLYQQQKIALKIILEDLIVKSNNSSATYTQVKQDLYDIWKRRFKYNYQESLFNNDWSWLRKPLQLWPLTCN